MSGNSVNTTATLQCPHGGMVQIISTNIKARAGGAPLARRDDSFVVTGCPYQMGTVPSPCVRVQWLITDSRVKVNNSATVSQSSTGLCLSAAGAPQGNVLVVNTQTRVRSQ
jgi:hypothetical protein